MKVLLLDSVPLSFGGGFERFLSGLAQYLAIHGHDVTIGTPPDRWARYMYKALSGQSIQDCPQQTQHLMETIQVVEMSPSAVRSLAEIYDVAYCKNEPHELLFAKVALRNRRCRLIVGLHTAPPPIADGRRRDMRSRVYFSAPYRQLFARNVDAVHVLQVASRQFVQSALRVSTSRVRLIPNGVDIDSFVPAKSDPGPPFTALFVGRLDRHKGADLLAASARLLEGSTDVPIQLLVAGDGPLREQLDTDAHLSCVRTLGYVANTAELYHRAHVVLSPSRRETHALVPAEAMASGLPVVVTDIPASSCYIAGGAIPVPAGDANALANAVTVLAREWVSKREEYRERCQQARAYAEREFNVMVQYKELLKLFEEVSTSSESSADR